MLMSYVGALKAWIYGPLLRNLGSNLYTLRLPVVLAGAASLWLFFLLLRRIAGDRAALIGCAILATDALYLLTATFDWGPVALQHLLLIGGALALVRFFQEGRTGSLAGAAFLFGLAIFDKALAVWTLSGLGAAGLIFYPRQILRAITLRRVAVAVLMFTLGALPLILYNVDSKGGTFQGNFERNFKDVPGKAAYLFRTFPGFGLFGWMTAEDEQTPQPHTPSTPLERATARISAIAGHPRHSLFLYAFILALLVAPLGGWPTLRLVLFALVMGAIAWIQMAVNQNTGGSIHHTILLWPIPQFIVAVSFAGVSYRLGRAGIPAVAAITAVVAVSGALVINEYFVKAVRNGGAPFWTDGIYSLSRYLKDNPAQWRFALDWSIADQIRLLHRGRVRVDSGNDQVSKEQMTDSDRAEIAKMLALPDSLYIAHTPEFEIFKGANERMLQFAAASGYRRELVAAIPDSFGRNVYEVYRFLK
jgi:4-amino-4-deoxy-L-arabinose transferase-like glycosyltransferase